MNEKTRKRLAQGWSKILLMAMALMATSMTAYAQSVPPNPCEDCVTVSGTVRSCNGTPLPGVTVRIEGQDFGTLRIKVTNASGFYSSGLLPPDTYVVTPLATTGYFFSPQNIVNTGGAANFTRYRRDNRANFDGDCRTDASIYNFNHNTGVWNYLGSSNGLTVSFSFGLTGDILTPGDYNGDGKTDFAVFRPFTTTWYIATDTSNSFYGVPFGLSSDLPVARDYDGDGKTDIAVFRPSTGDWHFLNSGSNNSYSAVHWGQNGDRPVPGDYDGDNKTDVAVFRPSNSTWYILRSSDGGVFTLVLGASSDLPVQADYDGDGLTDIAILNQSTGVWIIRNSSDGSYRTESWGLSTDQPAPGDYDGDGKVDIAIQRPSTLTWWILYSAGGSNTIYFPFDGLA
ncbi:MAG: FG-GAP-like repeat-containing protein, partial [Pyrinomonadaceae bacterium]